MLIFSVEVVLVLYSLLESGHVFVVRPIVRVPTLKRHKPPGTIHSDPNPIWWFVVLVIVVDSEAKRRGVVSGIRLDVSATEVRIVVINRRCDPVGFHPGRFAEAVELAGDVIKRFPETAVATELREQMSRLQERAKSEPDKSK